MASLPDRIEWTLSPTGERRITCPKCGESMTRGDAGLFCECGHRIWIARSVPSPTCPACNAPLRDRIDRPGLAPCSRCGWEAPGEAGDEAAPYKSPEHALRCLVEALEATGTVPSDLGSKLDRLEIGAVQTSRPRQIGRHYETLGTLRAPWDALDGEDRILLWLSESTPAWMDQAVRCVCGTEYQPAPLKRCIRCGCVRPTDEDVCECGAPEWVPADVCPRCGSKKRRPVKGWAARASVILGAYRRQLFVEAHGRQPFKKGEGEQEFDEAMRVGYCVPCGQWYRDSELWTRRRCPACKKAVRWGLNVTRGAVRKMVSAALERWRRELKERGLV